MNIRHPIGVLHLFSIKNIFYDKMELRFFYFDEAIYCSNHASQVTRIFNTTCSHNTTTMKDNVLSHQKYKNSPMTNSASKILRSLMRRKELVSSECSINSNSFYQIINFDLWDLLESCRFLDFNKFFFSTKVNSEILIKIL